MALTRARVVWGGAELAADIEAAVAALLEPPADADAVRRDASDMHRRMVEANAAERDDPWALKHAAGGIQECEYVLQAGAVALGLGRIGQPAEAAPALVSGGWLTAAEAEATLAALALATGVQQIERVALSHRLTPDAIGAGLRHALPRSLGFASIEALAETLAARQSKAADVARRLFGPAPDTP